MIDSVWAELDSSDFTVYILGTDKFFEGME